MRYMGDLSTGTLDETTKRQLLALAGNMTDGQASDLAEVVDATSFGQRQRWTRMGIGAALGVVVGVIGSRALGKRRR